MRLGGARTRGGASLRRGGRPAPRGRLARAPDTPGVAVGAHPTGLTLGASSTSGDVREGSALPDLAARRGATSLRVAVGAAVISIVVGRGRGLGGGELAHGARGSAACPPCRSASRRSRSGSDTSSPSTPACSTCVAASGLLVAAQAVVAVPFVVRLVEPVLTATGVELREQAAALGASPWQAVRDVVLPVARAILGAGAFAFAVALGEFGATAFVARLDSPTMPIAIVACSPSRAPPRSGQAIGDERGADGRDGRDHRGDRPLPGRRRSAGSDGGRSDRRRRGRRGRYLHDRRLLRGVADRELGAGRHEHGVPLAHARTPLADLHRDLAGEHRHDRVGLPVSAIGPMPCAPCRQISWLQMRSVSNRTSVRAASSSNHTRSRMSRGFIAAQPTDRRLHCPATPSCHRGADRPTDEGEDRHVTTYSYSSESPADVKAGLLIVPVFQGPKPGPGGPGDRASRRPTPTRGSPGRRARRCS